MGYGGGGWPWVFGGLLVVGLVGLIAVLVWTVLATTRRWQIHSEPTVLGAGVRSPARQILDERFARGEIGADEYTERLRVLGS